MDKKRDNHQADTPILRFAPDIAKNEMTDAEHKIKLRQQYQANMAAFAEKEIVKEKSKERESATELVSKEEENKVVAVTLEEINHKSDKQEPKPLSKKGVQFQLDEEKKNIVEKEVVYKIVGFGSVDHISRHHKGSGTDAKKTQTKYTPQYVKSTDRPGSSQPNLKDRQLERGLLSFKPVAPKHVLGVEKKERAKIKPEPASRQKQTTGMLLQQQQNTCILPNIRTGPKKVSWADPHPRQTCMVKPLPRGEDRTGLPTKNTTQRNPPTQKAFLTALPNNTAQIKRYFHAPYQLSNSKLPKR